MRRPRRRRAASATTRWCGTRSSGRSSSPDERADARQRPGGAGSPRSRADRAVAGLDEQRHRPVRRARRPPRGARRLEAERRIARAAAVDPEGPPEVDRAVDVDRPLAIRRDRDRRRSSRRRNPRDAGSTRRCHAGQPTVRGNTVRTRQFVAAPALIAVAALVTIAGPAPNGPGTARTTDLVASRQLAPDRPMPTVTTTLFIDAGGPFGRRPPRRHPAARAGRSRRARRPSRRHAACGQGRAGLEVALAQRRVLLVRVRRSTAPGPRAARRTRRRSSASPT